MDNPSEIKLIRQTPKSDDSLRCCAQMIFHFFGESLKKEIIWKRLHSYRKFSGLEGSFLTDLGLLSIKLGFKPIIYHFDWHWWNKTSFDADKKSNKALITTLKELKKDKGLWADKKIIDKEIKFLEKEGKIISEVPRTELIDNYLIQNIPVILNICPQDFYQSSKEDYRHSILVVGKKENLYLIKDPLMGLEEIDKEQLLVSWIRNGAWMLVILPKTTLKNIKQPELKF